MPIQKIIQFDNTDGYAGEVSLGEIVEKVNELVDAVNALRRRKKDE